MWLCVTAALCFAVVWGVSLVRPLGPVRVGPAAICVARGHLLTWYGWTPQWWEWSRAAVADAMTTKNGIGGIVWRGRSEIGLWTREGMDVRIAHWAALVGVPLWVPLIAASIAALAFARSRKTDHGCCSCCGYDLTGNVSGRCPECGTPIEQGGPSPT